jgi:hypothetical protein
MAVFGAIVGLIGMGVSAYQQHKAGQAAKEAGALEKTAALDQAKLLNYNATVADYQAADAIAIGAMEESRFREGVKGLIGEERAAFAGSNVNVGFGSALDVTADAAQLGELDALQIRSNAARAAFGFKVEAYDYREKARIAIKTGLMVEAQGRERAKQYNMQAFSTILGGATDFISTVGPSLHRGLKARSGRRADARAALGAF